MNTVKVDTIFYIDFINDLFNGKVEINQVSTVDD